MLGQGEELFRQAVGPLQQRLGDVVVGQDDEAEPLQPAHQVLREGLARCGVAVGVGLEAEFGDAFGHGGSLSADA